MIGGKFTLEKDFQVWLGRELTKLGFEVYTDKKICELPTFHGEAKKPDLLVFFKKNYKQNKQITLTSPIAIELKNTCEIQFNAISHSIIQIKDYYKRKYYTENWKGEIKNTLLCTPESISEEIVYKWANGNKEFNRGVDWAVIRVLYALSEQSRILKKDDNDFYIEFHNSKFYFLRNGFLGYKPNKWNNWGVGYDT